MKKIFLCALALSMALCGAVANTEVANANQEITQDDINEQNALSEASEQEEAKTVQDFLDEFEEEINNKYKIGWREIYIDKETGSSKTFYQGKASAIVNETDADFPKALQNAYEKAMIKLQGEYVKDIFGNLGNNKIKEYEADNSTNAERFEPDEKSGVFNQILGKVSNLAGATLDKALRDLGVDPTALTEEKKKTLFQEKFLNKTVTQALGNMSGLVPIKTYVAKGSNGGWEVGVVAVVSDKTQQIARDINNKRKPNISGAGKKISENLPKTKKGYLNEYGIRLVYNENGSPVIISYGSWGYTPKAGTNAHSLNRLEEIAQDTAKSKADAAIIEFVKTTISFNDERQTGEIVKDAIKKTTNLYNGVSSEETENITNIIDKVRQSIKSNAQGKLRGIRTLKHWSLKDENGINRVGVVRFYSYDNYENATKVANQESNQVKPVVKKQSKKVNRESKMVNSLDDF